MGNRFRDQAVMSVTATGKESSRQPCGAFFTLRLLSDLFINDLMGTYERSTQIRDSPERDSRLRLLSGVPGLTV